MRIENGALRSDTSRNRRAVVGLLLAVPFTVIFVTAYLNIDPLNGLMTERFISKGSINLVGSIVVLGSVEFLLSALMLNAAMVWRGYAAGLGISPYPFCLPVMIAMAVYIVFLFGSFVIDQYPCWSCVPNCD